MDEVFPQNYTVLLVGTPGAGKSEYCLDLAKGYLEDGEKVVYVTTRKSPADLRARMKEMGLDVGAYEGESLIFVDVFTRSTGKPGDTVLYVDNPSNLNLVSVTLSKAVERLGAPVRMIFDSLSTFFLHTSDEDIRRFFEGLNTKVLMEYGFAIYTLQDEMHDEKVVTALKSMVNAVLEMKLEETPSLRRRFRVLFAKDISYSQDWVDYYVTSKGFQLSPPGEVPVASGKKKKKKRITVKKAVIGIFLFFLFIAIISGDKNEAPQQVEVIPDAPTDTVNDTPTVTETAPPPEVSEEPGIQEFRISAMDQVNEWFVIEGQDVIVTVTTSDQYAKDGEALKVQMEFLEGNDKLVGLLKSYNDFQEYDGVSVWSYVPEPMTGRLALILKEEDGSDYMYLQGRSLKKTGWIKDTVPFSDFQLRFGDDNEDENSQLDLDQVKYIAFLMGTQQDTETQTRVVYLDELRVFRYTD